jgi:hypothetical protein
MKSFAIGLLYGIGGYVLFAFVGYFLILWFSSNTHDSSVEAAMTSALIIGPLGLLVGFIAGFIAGS